jgi:hypothetical protein
VGAPFHIGSFRFVALMPNRLQIAGPMTGNPIRHSFSMIYTEFGPSAATSEIQCGEPRRTEL